MQFEICDALMAEAHACRRAHVCLRSHAKDLCRVEHCVDGKVHFVVCREHDTCAYQRSFGESVFCDCPVRKELFNKYRV